MSLMNRILLNMEAGFRNALHHNIAEDRTEAAQQPKAAAVASKETELKQNSLQRVQLKYYYGARA